MRTKSILVLMLAAGLMWSAPSSFSVRGHVHPLAQRRFDRGRVNGLFQLNHVSIMFKPSAAQQKALNELLDQQQDPSSPNYHQWVTPEQFADRFGMSSAEFDRITMWLQDQGFTIDDRARSRNWIAFTGTARQMEQAFKAQIHEYMVNGQTHYATATEPAVPVAFGDRVLGFRGLHDFRPKSHMIRKKFTSSISGNHYIVPDDWATIYDAQSVYSGGLTGSGQNIAVMGVSDIELGDIRSFRAASGLPAMDPQTVLIPGSKDPGVVSGDVDEASLDIEWAGAIARNATIIFVISSTASAPFDALQYAVSQNLAPVMSLSYGDCEQNWATTDINSLVATTQQANAQGITISVASGDSGGADCDLAIPVTRGLSVDLPAALPYVTAIGGTEFNESGAVWSSATQAFSSFFGKGTTSAYWSSTNNGKNGSALSYIPEYAWNDSLFDGQPSSSGGGKSTLYTKPSWQVAPGVPNDGGRDVPDISFSASADTDGYLACIQGNCANGFRAADNSLQTVGGTSVGAPTFAGIVSLINQMTGARQGNVNSTLYRLATTNRTVFHDTVQGGNQVQCQSGSPNCPAPDYYGVSYIGFSATPGYDLATGLGSVDVSKLLQAWPKSGP